MGSCQKESQYGTLTSAKRDERANTMRFSKFTQSQKDLESTVSEPNRWRSQNEWWFARF